MGRLARYLHEPADVPPSYGTFEYLFSQRAKRTAVGDA
jgi:hypothetical protein